MVWWMVASFLLGVILGASFIIMYLVWLVREGDIVLSWKDD